MDEKKKLLLARIGAVIFLGFVIFWFLGSDIEHIEDTNGPDNYNLTTITDENMIKLNIGDLGLKKHKGMLSGDLTEFSSKKYTGVTEIMFNNYIGKSDAYFQILNFHVTEGNFKMYVVLDDKIIDEIEPDMMIDYRIEDISGRFSLRIAGESAAFTFGISGMDYDNFEHH